MAKKWDGESLKASSLELASSCQYAMTSRGPFRTGYQIVILSTPVARKSGKTFRFFANGSEATRKNPGKTQNWSSLAEATSLSFLRAIDSLTLVSSRKR